MAKLPSLSDKEAVIMAILGTSSTGLNGMTLVELARGQLLRGTVYVTLARLEAKAFVESHQEVDLHRAGTPRRIYTSTAYGRKVYSLLRRAAAHP